MLCAGLLCFLKERHITLIGDLTIYLGLVEACHFRVAIDDRFEFGVARDFIEGAKPSGARSSTTSMTALVRQICCLGRS
jgi:hypothetical protein